MMDSIEQAPKFRPLMPLEERISEVRATQASRPKIARRLAIFDTACASIDRDAFAHIQAKYAENLRDFDPLGDFKYLDLPFWIWHKTAVSEMLNIDISPELSILDLGMGAGHFGLICRSYGHRVVGIDIENDIYQDMADVFGIERIVSSIEAREPLPIRRSWPFGRKFDLVTAFQAMFHFKRVSGTRVYWSLSDWEYFFDDLDRRWRSGGRFYLDINPFKRPNGELEWNYELTEACERNGAKIIRPGRRLFFEVDREIAFQP